MHWLKSSEERSSSVLQNPERARAVGLMLGGERAITGRLVNEGSALSIAAVYNAVTVIAGDLGTIPLKVYRKEKGKSRAEAVDHPLYDLLVLEPTPMVSSAAWREASQGHLLLRGNAYTEIIRNRRGQVTELVPHNPTDIERTGEVYKVRSHKKMLHASEMLHIPGPGGNGVDGWSVIKLARENWALAAALEESNARFIANASRPSGFLTTNAALKPETLAKLKDLWGRRNAGLDNVGGTPVLDGGFTWQQVALSAEDTQYIQSRQFSVTDIARWFNVPPHKIKDLDRATFSNVEQQAIDYVVNTLRPWVVRWEQAMNVKLLTAAERRAGYYVNFNLDGLLRGDIQTRSAAYRTQFEIGALTPNEVRALEERPPVENGDDAYVRLDMAPLARLDEIQSPAASSNDDGQRAETRSREYRSPDSRLRLRSSYEPIVMGAAKRMVFGEVRDIRRLVEKHRDMGDLREKIEAYYFDDLPNFASKVMGEIFIAYAEAMAAVAAAEIDSDVRIDAGAFADAYTDKFVNRYAARSRRDLVDREPDEIEQRLQVWTEGGTTEEARHVQVTGREIVKLGDAVARSVFVAGGVLSLVWRSIGDSCPYCKRLDGKRVDSRSSFIEVGEAFTGEGTDVPLVPKSTVRHAPAHRGCNCTILPGI